MATAFLEDSAHQLPADDCACPFKHTSNKEGTYLRRDRSPSVPVMLRDDLKF